MGKKECGRGKVEFGNWKAGIECGMRNAEFEMGKWKFEKLMELGFDRGDGVL